MLLSSSPSPSPSPSPPTPSPPLAGLNGVVASRASCGRRTLRLVLAGGSDVFPLLHGLRRVAEDLEPHDGVAKRRPVVHVARDAGRQRGFDQSRQQLPDLSEPIQLLPGDR